MADLNTVRASAPARIVLIETLEVLHDSFDAPIRLVNQPSPFTATLEATAPEDAGQSVTFEPAGFEIVLPDASAGGAEVIDVLISNVNQVAARHLEIAIDNPGPVTLIYRNYMSDDTSGPAEDPPTRLTIVSAVADTQALKAKARNADNINKKFPSLVYNVFDHPGTCTLMYDWIQDYLAATFKHDAYGPREFDCYGLLWHVNFHQAGIDLPRFDDMEGQLARINAAIEGQKLSADWQAVERPEEFDAVVMQQRASHAYHVGVWLNVDGGKVLHATPSGILCSDLGALRRMGFRQVQYYRHAHH